MAQKRLRDYQDDLGSFEHNLFNLGVHAPGRFAGFDTLFPTGNPANAREFELRHTKTGFSYKNAINNIIGPIGVLLTPQGVLVQEDASIGPLTVDTNAGNTFTRYDLVYLNHDYTVTVGGDAATYAIKKGPIGSTIKPILTDPLKQVVIGLIELPPNAANAAEFIWHKAKNPDSGDGEDARLYTPNLFKATQGQSKSDTILNAPSETGVFNGVTAMFYDLQPDGNLYPFVASDPRTLDAMKIHDLPPQEGMRIYLMVNDKVLVRENTTWIADPISAKGYKPIKVPQGMGNEKIGNALGGGTMGVRAAAGEEWELEFIFYSDQWILIKIGGAGAKSTFNRGDLLPVWGVDMEGGLSFDGTGLGKNLRAGWAICNGLNGTPDLRGQVLAMATYGVPAPGRMNTNSAAETLAAGGDPNDYLYNNPYALTGNKSMVILQENLPDINFPVSDPGHRHGIPLLAGSDSGGGSVTSGAATGNDGAPLSNIAYTGIVVSSGGSGTPLAVDPPRAGVVMLMKL